MNRRRVVAASLVLALALSACGHTASSTTKGTANSVVTTHAVVTSTMLPTSWWFNSVTASAQGPLLSGIVAGTADHPSCMAAYVGTGLQPMRVQYASCDSPHLQGRSVTPVVTPAPQSNSATVSIASLDPTTKKVVISPPIMTFNQASDTHTTWSYASDGSLWVYDVDTTNGAEAIEVSSSGLVETKASTPQLYRPELAANDEGLWLGNSVEGGCGSEGCSDALYHVAPGSTTATDVLKGNTQTIFWMVGSGSHLWLGIGPVFYKEQTWRLDGPDARVVFTAPDHFGPETAVSGAPTMSVVGGTLPGLWTVAVVPLRVQHVPASSDQDIVRIDPDSGNEQVVAVLKDIPTSPSVGVTGPQLAYSNGSLYVLEPPFQANAYLGYSTIVQVKEKTCPRSQACHGS